MIGSPRGRPWSGRLRWVLSWVNALEATEPSARPVLWNEEPGDSGDVRWDALLTGLAEHFAVLPALDIDDRRRDVIALVVRL